MTEYNGTDGRTQGRRSSIVHALGISAAVLAGGQSRRMGSDKALIQFDGVTLIEHAIATLRPYAVEVLIIGDRAAYHDFGVPVVGDAFPNCGPLGGIATALRAACHDHVFVVACDMPFLSPTIIEAMRDQPRDYDVLIPALPAERSAQGDETLETLHAIYTRRCLQAIERRIATRRYKVAEFLDTVRVRRLDERWLRSYDPELRSFVNVNTASDLAAAGLIRETAR